MTATSSAPRPANTELPEDEADQIGQNIAAVHEFYARQARDLGRSQRLAETIANAIGHPAFLGAILGLVALWVAANSLRSALGLVAPDPPPYFWLQGLVSLSALLITTVVLIKQNRLARLAEQRAHLDLKVSMLIEQKTAKVIHLLEELRRDAPNIPDRHDAHAAALQQALSPGRVLAALDEAAPLSNIVEPTAVASTAQPGIAHPNPP